MTDKIMHAAIRNLASQIGKVSAKQRASEVRKAVVVAVAYNNTTGNVTADLHLSGDTTVVVPSVNVVQGVSPNVGDVVNVLKQGPTMAVVSQIGTQTDGGFITATLSTGFTHNGDSQGSLQYRIVNDNGATKMQWQGAVARSANITVIASTALLAPYRPTVKRKLLAARGFGGGDTSCQVIFNTDGSVVLEGATYTSPSFSLGTSATENAQHDHGFFNAANGFSYTTNTENEQHGHDLGTATYSVTAPDWVSFHGLEYFL